MLDRWFGDRPTAIRLLRFACVGLGATLVHFIVAIALVSNLGAPPAVANASAVLMATVFSYTANTLWSFSAPFGHRTLSRFLVVSALVALLAALMSGLFERLGLDYRLGVLATVVSVPPLSFWLHHSWTYRDD